MPRTIDDAGAVVAAAAAGAEAAEAQPSTTAAPSAGNAVAKRKRRAKAINLLQRLPSALRRYPSSPHRKRISPDRFSRHRATASGPREHGPASMLGVSTSAESVCGKSPHEGFHAVTRAAAATAEAASAAPAAYSARTR